MRRDLPAGSEVGERASRVGGFFLGGAGMGCVAEKIAVVRCVRSAGGMCPILDVASGVLQVVFSKEMVILPSDACYMWIHVQARSVFFASRFFLVRKGLTSHVEIGMR